MRKGRRPIVLKKGGGYCSIGGFLGAISVGLNVLMLSYVEGLRSGLLENTTRALFMLIGMLLGGHFP